MHERIVTIMHFFAGIKHVVAGIKQSLVETEFSPVGRPGGCYPPSPAVAASSASSNNCSLR